MKRIAWLARLIVSVGILIVLVAYISPQRVLTAMRGADWRAVMLAGTLLPVFLSCRIFKWYLLTRQVAGEVGLSRVVRGYLWGMSLGLVTPGRAGELARVWGSGLPKRCYGLFVLEKVIEVTCLGILAFVSLVAYGILPAWALLPGAAVLCVALLKWRAIAGALSAFGGRAHGKQAPEGRDVGNSSIRSLRIGPCALLTLVCPLVYCFQACLILRSMDPSVSIAVMGLTPLVLVGNLVPIAIGGTGVRETIAVMLLRHQGVADSVAFSAFFLVGVMDLFVPALIGGVMYMYCVLRARVPCQRPVRAGAPTGKPD